MDVQHVLSVAVWGFNQVTYLGVDSAKSVWRMTLVLAAALHQPVKAFGNLWHATVISFGSSICKRLDAIKMKTMTQHASTALLLMLCAQPSVHANGQADANGFVEDASVQLHNRFVFERIDYQKGDRFKTTIDGQALQSSTAQESGYGAMLTLKSGFTQGLVGLGLDAHAYGALAVNADDIRGGRARYLAKDSQGHVRSQFGRVGAAVKLRMSSTVLAYGELRTKNPIFNSSDSRLLPETNRGFLLTSTDIAHLLVQAGHFTGWSDRNSRGGNFDLRANYSGTTGSAFRFVGGHWQTPIEALKLSLYWGQFKDNWNTFHFGAAHSLALQAGRSVDLNLNVYRSDDTGVAKAGPINNTTWSALASYRMGMHKLGLGYQKVAGDTPFDYVNRGSIWLDNAMQLSDFNGPHEASWQVKYEADWSGAGLPGLVSGLAYTRGSGTDGSRVGADSAYYGAYGQGGKHWERDMMLRYNFIAGAIKNVSLQLNYSVQRANSAQSLMDKNFNQWRLLVNLPVVL
ncbi:OprD family outer membrane porin [Lampropedia aestuarii]|nr:OprD family outer membrane porin [Lampropedia aestuarii]